MGAALVAYWPSGNACGGERAVRGDAAAIRYLEEGHARGKVVITLE